MFPAILTVGGIGLIAGLGLAIASRVFYVYVDPKVLALLEALPGANCGGCGFPGCSGAAAAIVKGEAAPNICVGGGTDVHAKVAEILGVELKEREPDFARPGCYYGVQEADLKYRYDGLADCRAALLLGGGAKVCPIGCLGLGTCVKACPFGALSMGSDGLPTVSLNLCTGCGTCERVCPKHIITLSSNSTRVQQEYTTEECTAPCQRTCPAGIDIPSYILKISQGDYLGAVRVIKEKNPLPLVCGRICVHPCEFECRRNLMDEPVSINGLKRFAADFEMKSGERVNIYKAPATGKRVAVVGGGAEGLTTAYFLASLGHEPKIYEAMPKLGGLLRTVIPETRLPRDVLDYEIDSVMQMGVSVETGKKLGRDFTIDSVLQDGSDAVFVATGGWDTQLASGTRAEPVQVLPGVQLLAHFTLGWMAGRAPAVGKRVVILGGGNASVDAARICRESGAEEVHVLVRSRREDFPFSESEIRTAEREGVRFHYETALTRMMGTGRQLTHVETARLEGSPGGSGASIAEGSLRIIEADVLLAGAGRFPELIYARQPSENGEDAEGLAGPVKWVTVSPYPGPFAEEDIGIFRPGEATTDYKAVVEAIGSGRRAAASVHKFLMGQDVEPPAGMIRKATRVVGVNELQAVSAAPRQAMPEIAWEERVNNPSVEVELGFSEAQALEEANRCLRCGLICYRKSESSTVSGPA
jgi:NADPH-dependent glutamate synthase beta subunit-like oxidoreductase